MINGKRIVVVMPAYNAEKTLRQTHSEIPMDVVDEVILVDDASRDNTAQVAKELRTTGATGATRRPATGSRSSTVPM
jgi:glycosyltransferase involved in cell wall biosynthesis